MTRKSKKNKVKDPYAKREAKKYEHPIPSREAILDFMSEAGELMKLEQLAKGLGLSSDRDVEALQKRVNAMLRAGQIIQNRRQGFGLSQKMDLTAGRVTGHPDGFGFVIPDDGSPDIFISPRFMRQVMHGDRVLANVTKVDRQGRLEGEVVEVLERAHSHLVGRMVVDRGVGFVQADQKRITHDIMIPPGEWGDAKDGDYVYIEMTEHPGRSRKAKGRVLEVLGRSINAPMAAEVAIRSFDLPHEWPAEVRQAMREIPDHVSEAEIKGRKDLRDTPLVTIDGSDAKDFDDAVHCEPVENGGWKLLVAIADVAHYVRPGSPIDNEAQKRGTSVYFPNRVVPMLPEALSNGICSLNPKVDRLCMVCEMRVDSKGDVTRSRFYAAVMHSHARLTYAQAWQFVEQGQGDFDASVAASLTALHSMFKAMLGKRMRRGALDFDSSEVAFRFGDDGTIDEIVPRTRNDAHRLIEECMIAANVEAAKLLEKKEINTLFRVHASPPERKLEELRTALAELGLQVPGGDEVTPSDLARVLASAKGRNDYKLIQTLILRSQSLAVYLPENHGHFGLALSAYSHFTSPIRRYPDLVMHRALYTTMKFKTEAAHKYSDDQINSLAQHTSMTERRAEEASRDVDERLKCAYMEQHIGDEFDGIIAGVTSFGLFVELEEFGISGLIHVTQLPNDYYHFDAVSHTLSGERRGKVFQLSDPVRVKVVRVNVDDREIDFKLTKTRSESDQE